MPQVAFCIRGTTQTAPTTISEWWRRMPMLMTFAAGASAAMFLIAGYGAAEVLLMKESAASRDQYVHTGVALLWLATAVASQLAARTLVEGRSFLPPISSRDLIRSGSSFRAACDELDYRTTRRRIRGGRGLCDPHHCFHPERQNGRPQTGYAEIAAAIPFDPRSPWSSVSSDASGEGSLFAERLIRDSARDGFVLRGNRDAF